LLDPIPDPDPDPAPAPGFTVVPFEEADAEVDDAEDACIAYDDRSDQDNEDRRSGG
jgi:hypothetical protein